MTVDHADRSGFQPLKFSGLAGLGEPDPMDSARLMGMITALAAEVYVLKAEVQRLRLALEASGATSAAELERAGQSPAMRDWFSAEEAAFGQALLRPFTHPDEAPDVSGRMGGR